QKDAAPPAKPTALPDLGPLPVVHQEPLGQEQPVATDQPATQPGSEDAVITLFRQSLQTTVPQLNEIGLKTEQTVRQDWQLQIEKTAPQQLQTFGVFPIGVAQDVETVTIAGA